MMMTANSARSVEIEAQVEAYRSALLAAGMYAVRAIPDPVFRCGRD
jgi:hypothetical protein